MDNFSWITTLVAAICTAVGSLLTLWWTKGTQAQIMLMRERKESNLAALEDLVKKYESLQCMYECLEGKCEDVERLHHQCEVRCARLETRVEMLEKGRS